jgi:hypothetical protein
MPDSGLLWEQVVSPENLWLAWRRAARGKRRRLDVACFFVEIEQEFYDLARELREGRYQPGGYRHFTIHDGKPRNISAAPFRDRVVHHALMQIVEPLLESVFLDNSWACRKRKGTHAAVRQYQRWARRYAYALKMDVAAYFASIDQGKLLEKIRHLIDDPDVITLFTKIVHSYEARPGKGLPLGNLTSQILGNLYLHDLDCLITRELNHPAYLRYVDDLIVLGDDKVRLWDVCSAVGCHLAEEGLVLHPRKVSVTPTRCGLDVLGYRVYPRHIRLRPGNGYRARRRLKTKARLVSLGLLSREAMNASLQSWLGHARQAQTHGLRRAILSDIMVQVGAGETRNVARRGLEQQTSQPAFRQPQQEPTR